MKQRWLTVIVFSTSSVALLAVIALLLLNLSGTGILAIAKTSGGSSGALVAGAIGGTFAFGYDGVSSNFLTAPGVTQIFDLGILQVIVLDASQSTSPMSEFSLFHFMYAVSLPDILVVAFPIWLLLIPLAIASWVTGRGLFRHRREVAQSGTTE